MKVTKNVIIILLAVITVGAVYTISSTISLKSKQLKATEAALAQENDNNEIMVKTINY